jgi:hypothetical protein
VTLLVTLADGPLARSSFEVERCPRVVRCVRSIAGKIAILEQPSDAPEPDETVHWYRWDGNPPGHICGRRCVQTVHLVHAPEVRGLEDARRERQLELQV